MARDEIIQVLAGSDPLKASQLLPRPPVGASELDGTTRHVIERLTAEKPGNAASWVTTFPPGVARRQALAAVVSNWTPADPQAAFSWLANLNNQELRAEATQALIAAYIEQPREIRDQWLTHADPRTSSELERATPAAEELEE